MRTASVRVVQHRLSEVLSLVAAGEEIAVTRHNRVVAKIVPVAPGTKPRIDFAGRLATIFPSDVCVPNASSGVVVAERAER